MATSAGSTVSASARGDILDQFEDGPAHLAVIELSIGAQQPQCTGNGKELERRGRCPPVAALPTIGFMSARAPDDSVRLLAAFRRGLAEEGFVLYSATSRQRSIVAPSLRSWTVIVRALIKAVTTGRDTRA